ncbi:MAG: NUDIX domain-containing protein [Pseudomonadota bacterium]
MEPKTRNFKTPLVTVDLAIFTVRDDALAVLLVQRAATAGDPHPLEWALPGGFIDIERDSDLVACARRKLKEKTGLVSPYLEQLGSWGSRKRDPRGWSVTQVYFSLLPSEGIELRAGANTASVRWARIEEGACGIGERLAFDHGVILEAALERLRGKVEYTSLPAFLLPGEFTLSELQRAYEIVLSRPIEKSAFRTRVKDAGLVDPLPRMRRTTSRPARLYRLKDRAAPVYFPRTFSPRS